jgi:hypothetical protein
MRLLISVLVTQRRKLLALQEAHTWAVLAHDTAQCNMKVCDTSINYRTKYRCTVQLSVLSYKLLVYCTDMCTIQ